MRRRKPCKPLKPRAITPDRAKELVDIIACDDREINEALVELIAGIMDRDGDPARADAGLNALLHAFTHMATSYEALCVFLARTSPASAARAR
jgi:hypothetical protein